MAEPSGSYAITPDSGALHITGGRVELWKYGTYAPAWFADAQREASLGDEQTKRREIIFAVCAIESYLFEWVRDEVLKKDFPLLDVYFPVTTRRIGIGERWKEVIKSLRRDNRIIGEPTFTESYWKEFRELVDFRNGLVHGGASRPDTEGLTKEQQPQPTSEQLQAVKPGWAVGVVATAIGKLHEAVHTPPPTWIGT